MVQGFAGESGQRFCVLLPHGRGQRGPALPSAESAVTCLAPGHRSRKGNRLFSHFSLKQRLVHSLSCFFLSSFSMDSCHRAAHTDSIKVFFGSPPTDPAQWTTQLLLMHSLGTTDLPRSSTTSVVGLCLPFIFNLCHLYHSFLSNQIAVSISHLSSS